MQPRLTRSTTEKMIAGVCGGLGEYFQVDPVIVRVIFVLVTLTSGMGLPVYIVLWIVMPRADKVARNSYQQGMPPGSQGHPHPHQGGREVMVSSTQQPAQQRRVDNQGVFEQQPPFPGFERGGEPSETSGAPVTGETLRLPPEQQGHPATGGHARRRGKDWGMLGAILIGVGVLVLLERFGLELDEQIIFPAMLILAGLFLLGRGRKGRHHS